MAFELLSSLVAHVGLAPMGRGVSAPQAVSAPAGLPVALALPVDELHSPGIQLVEIVRGIGHLVRCVTWAEGHTV